MGKTNSILVPIFTGEPEDYETDFHAWSMEQSSRLRRLRIPGLDTENLAEEIESLGSRDRRELESRFAVLLHHLLKWKYQPSLRGLSWENTIDEQRDEIEALLKQSPSLRRFVPDALLEAYRRAVKKVRRDTNLPFGAFPAVCEWTPEQILSEDFRPE